MRSCCTTRQCTRGSHVRLLPVPRGRAALPLRTVGVAVAGRWAGAGALSLYSTFDDAHASPSERARPERDRTHRIRCGPSWVWRCALRDLSRDPRSPSSSVGDGVGNYCHTGILDRASRRASRPPPRDRTTVTCNPKPNRRPARRMRTVIGPVIRYMHRVEPSV